VRESFQNNEAKTTLAIQAFRKPHTFLGKFGHASLTPFIVFYVSDDMSVWFCHTKS